MCVCVCVWLCVVHICIASFIHKWVHLLTDIYPFLIFGHSKTYYIQHIMIPWFQTPHKFDIRTRPRLINTVTGTKDLQNVNLTLRVTGGGQTPAHLSDAW